MTDDDRRRLTEYLFAEHCSCVIRKGSEIRVFRQRGVRDLYELLTREPEFLDGAYIADKVVGKGAAALMILGGAGELFADVISRPASELLRRARIKVDYTIQVPHIINRTHTGICPVEQACSGCRTAQECLPRIEAFLNQTKDK